MSDSNKPIKEVRIGSIKAAIWANARDGGATRYNVTITRNYLSDGQWKQTSSYNVGDLPVLQKVTDRAFEAVLELQSQDDPGTPGSNATGHASGQQRR